MKKILALSAVLLLFAAPAFAAEFVAPEMGLSRQSNGVVNLASTETHKNLHVIGSVVTVNSATQGDLLAAGGIVKITGNVQDDLFVVGGRVDIDAPVGKNVHVLGGSVGLNKTISGDLVAAGGLIQLTGQATGDGDLSIAAKDVVINGTVTGNVSIMASRSLSFGPQSHVTGKITYKGPEEAVVSAGAKVNAINFTKVNKRYAQQGGIVGLLIISSIFKFIMLLVAGLVLAWLIPAKVSAVVKQAMDKPAHSFGIGLLVLILAPIVGLILFFTVIGFYLGVIVFLAYGLFIVASSILMLFYIGKLAWSWYDKNATTNRWRDLGVGAVIALLLGLIPILGWILLTILWLITLGALKMYWYKEQFLE